MNTIIKLGIAKFIDFKITKEIKYLILALNAILLIRIIAYAWVTDDAFISFRSVINFVEGYGPVYNIGERVQSFTNPLWFLLLSLGGFMKLNIYYWSIMLGIALSGGLLWLFYRVYKKTDNIYGYVLVLIALIFSESFLSFQTSGLENSMTNILIVLFLYLYLFINLEDTRYFSLFLFLGSLILLNRLDSLFVIILPLMHVFWIKKDKFLKKMKIGILAFLPIISWICFSLIYYGFAFPNTKYVKVGGRTLVDSFTHGFQYLLEYVITEIHIVILFFITIFIILRSILNFKLKILIASIFLYTFYVLSVGGDFMRGRFLVIVSVVILFLFLNINLAKRFNVNYKYFVCGAIFFLVLSVATYVNALKEIFVMSFPITNERNYYKDYLALKLDPYHRYNNHPWAVDAQQIDKESNNNKMTIVGMSGLKGYFSGRNITIIDTFGLTDAFISRLPVLNSDHTGHFVKDIPSEYFQERISDSEVREWKNNEYKELNQNINIIIRSEQLFSKERFKSMLWVWKKYGI